MHTNLTAMLSAEKSAEGMLRLLIFMVGLIAVFWGINIFRHKINGNWTKFQKVADIIGMILLIVLLIMLIAVMI